MLRPAVAQHVADVEVPADDGIADLVEEFHGLDGAEDEVVPDVLDGDLHAEFLGERHSLLELSDGAIPGLLVGHVIAHGAGNDEDGIRAIGLRIAEGLKDPLQAFLAGFFIGMGERLLPVRVAAHAGGLQAGLAEGI